MDPPLGLWSLSWDIPPGMGAGANQVGAGAWETVRSGWDFLGRRSFGVFSGVGLCLGLLLHLPFNLACLSVRLPPIYLISCSMASTFHSESGHWDS